MKMDREQFEALAPELGHTPEYKIFALQSDHFLSEYDVTKFDTYYIIFIPLALQPEVCKLITTFSQYTRLCLKDTDTYLRVLETATKYRSPFGMDRELCAKILEIRPDFIHYIPNKYIDTTLYLDYIKYRPNPIHLIAMRHFKNKEFLLYILGKQPDLLLKTRYQSLLTPEILTLYPKYIALYPQADEPPPRNKTRHIITAESLAEHLHRREIPKGKIPKELFTPETIEEIIQISSSYMIASKYRQQFITRELFERHYIHYLDLFFQHYIDHESLNQYYEATNVILFDHIHLYDDELLCCVIDRNIVNIQDPVVVYKLVSASPGLAKYVSPEMLLRAAATRAKSARS